MSKQLDEILDFCFEGEVSWVEDQLDGTSYYEESMEGIDKRKAEAKVKLQKLMVESRLDEVERADCQYNDGAIPLYQYFSERTDKLEKELEDDQL